MAVALVLALLVLTLLNVAWEWISVEIFAVLVMATLAISGVLTPQEAFGGFANSAILMIAGVMILTGSIIHNGAADVLARNIERFSGRSERKAASLLLLSVNAVSAFINNVAATAMFIPVAEGMAKRFKVGRSRYLIPVAFASMTGGMCTLIGTSTNVAVAGAMPHYGLDPLGLFELTPVGIAVAVVGVGYLLWGGPKLLDRPQDPGALDTYGIREFLFEVLVEADSALAGAPLVQADLGRRLGVNVLVIVRGEERIVAPSGLEVIRAGDLLLVEGRAGTIPEVAGTKGLEIKSMTAPQREGLQSDRAKLVEATVSFNSSLVGRTLKELNFRHQFGVSVLAIHRSGESLDDKVGKLPLKPGDVLLIYGYEERFARLAEEPAMLVVENLVLPNYRPVQALTSLGIFTFAILVSALGWVDSATAFLAGGALVLALGCMSVEDASGHLNFKFLVLLAGMISLAVAMERSGAAELVARTLVDLFETRGPLVLLGGFYLLTVLLTQPLNNAAAALLVLPIAVHAAEAVGANPRTFAIGVTLAASCSFLTPFEPACLLVYGTGHYRLRDFFKVGGLLTLIAFAISMFLLPWIWPL